GSAYVTGYTRSPSFPTQNPYDGDFNGNYDAFVIKLTCDCPKQGDITGDALLDVFDVIGVIGIAFSGEQNLQDPACPTARGDVDNNGVTDVYDVLYLIATAFSGGADPINPCGG
ncbi:MAG: hypothetical protein HZB43_12745, partial [candidate division Zixibacteria bacterium]|nr:hypothetical protein [candidate division Zixibacteria bacterium]